MDRTDTLAPMATSMSWWQVQGRRFLITVAVVALAVVLAGWLTDLRQVMHGALLSVAIVAFLPLLIVGAGLLAVLAVGLVVGVLAALGDGGDGVIEGAAGVGEVIVEGGGWLTPRYYRFLGRQRHPMLWGTVAGALLGGLLLWGLLAVLVVPDEASTARRLTEAKARLEARYAADGAWPRPDGQGQLVLDVGNGPAPDVLRDGFGRPLHYEVSGRWKLASWRLRSHGYDGVPSGDDLCISGASKLAKWVARAGELVNLFERIRAGEGSTRDRLAGIRALRCDGELDAR